VRLLEVVDAVFACGDLEAGPHGGDGGGETVVACGVTVGVCNGARVREGMHRGSRKAEREQRGVVLGERFPRGEQFSRWE
jgi:hypothetical protein